LLTLVVLVVSARSAQGQSVTDLIRGRVTDDSSRVVVGATVSVTRGPDRAFRQVATDSTGRYEVRFEDGTGDYLVAVTAAGFKPVRRRVQRLRDETMLIADFVLSRDLTTLAAVKVTAPKPERAREDVSPFSRETGSSEKWADGVAGQLPPSLAGDLNALAATMPGITVGAGGLSMLGAGSESNLTTLNGMALAAGSLPRAARVNTRVTGATFDPTRGGFAGANIDTRLEAGSRDYQRRDAYLTLDPSPLQFTDALGRSLGARTGSVRGSLGADGELIRRSLTYNVALDFLRAENDPATLLAASDTAFLRAGVAPDSVARLLTVARLLGLARSGGGIPANHERESVSWLGRIDDTRDSLDLRTLTTYASWLREGALNFAPLSAPSAGAERRQRTLGAQLEVARYVGPGQRALNRTQLSASQVHDEATPYLAQPGASVLVRSPSGSATDFAALTLGGASYLASDVTRWTAEGSNETVWHAHGRKHTFKVLGWARTDGTQQQGSADLLGHYTFNSIAGFAANQPASFTRTLAQPVRTGAAWNAAFAVAHQWAPSRWFNLIYGARAEADGFGDAPARNVALEDALGVATGVVPSRLHVSPRVGFSWTYNRDKDNGNGMSNNPVGSFYRNSTGVIRGGIGEFRDLLKPGLLADARAGTGLPGSASALTCIGAAAPAPDWNRFLGDPSAIPSRCTDGTGPLAELSPPVSLISRGFDVPRSWRASLDWNGNVGAWLLKAGALGSWDLSQPGIVDANFAGTPRLTLAGEGGRPVFVSAAAIDAASGAVSAVESRRSAAFGRVAVQQGDLRGYGGQLSISVSPDVFRMRRVPGSPFVSLGYTLQSSRREYRGFDGDAFGDPRVKEWAASSNDARHIVVLQGGFYTQYTGTWTFFARAQSGLPFTPIVQGDVNGDGRGDDRAFVPDAAAEADPALAAQLRSLLANGSSTARACVEAYAGRPAERNGCRGPWTTSLNAQWRPPLPRSIARRVQMNVYFQNVFGGLDQLLHGADGVHGWGAAASPDPVLLIPRGFDAAASRFRYDVNARFADTRPSRVLSREPFRISIDLHLPLSTDFDLQRLRRALEPVKVEKRWERRSADSITAFYLSSTSDLFKVFLEESDSLFLSATQMAALRRADSVFSTRVRAIYMPLGQYLAGQADGASRTALDSATAAEKAYWRVFWEQPEIADSLITPAQRELLPMMKGMLGVPKKEREDSQWQFGHPVRFNEERRPGA
jgi:hypothetical protein